MITLFHVFPIIVPVFSATIGAGVGASIAGNKGAVIGALAGFLIGVFLARIPAALSFRAVSRELSRKETGELLAELREHRTFAPNFVLLELASRGHDISLELPSVLALLESEHFHFRTRGWAAMLSAFPTVAHQMSPYSPAQSTEQCRADVAHIREKLLNRGA